MLQFPSLRLGAERAIRVLIRRTGSTFTNVVHANFTHLFILFCRFRCDVLARIGIVPWLEAFQRRFPCTFVAIAATRSILSLSRVRKERNLGPAQTKKTDPCQFSLRLCIFWRKRFGGRVSILYLFSFPFEAGLLFFGVLYNRLAGAWDLDGSLVHCPRGYLFRREGSAGRRPARRTLPRREPPCALRSYA